MSSPVAHAIAGVGVVLLGLPYRALTADTLRLRASGLALAATLAIAPDLDFLPVALLGWDQRLVHRTYSHSLAAALLAALLLGPLLATRLAVSVRRGMALAGAAYMSHLALDLLCYDELPPLGVNLLWPFSPRFTPPLAILPSIDPRAILRGDLLPLSVVLLDEVLVVGGAVACTLIVRTLLARHRQQPSSAR